MAEVRIKLKLKDWKEMDRIARNVKRKVGRMEVGMWPFFFGSDQRGSEGN